MRFIRQLCFVCIAFASSAWAQSVRWEPATGRLSFNQVNELQLVFDDCEPSEDPAIPTVPNLQMQSNGSASNMSVTNGHISQSVTITINVRATERAPVTIPAFSVNTNKGRLEVPAATYQVGDATVGQSNIALNAIANARLDVPKEVWAGEVFKLEYNLSVIRRYLYSPNGNRPDWDSAPLTVEDWARPDAFETNINGERRVIVSFKTRALAKKPGEITLNPASQTVNLTTGSTSFGFFAQPNLQPFSITSSRSTINVKPLPPGAPESFKGAVGHFTFESKVVPATGAVGEPITWTLNLAGNGNWSDIAGVPSREVSRDFRVVQPQARRVMKENSLFDGTLSEDVVLIPTQPGSYTLGPLNWTYFDPTKGEYQTITTPKVVVAVSAPAVQPTAPANPTNSVNGNSTSNNSGLTGRAPNIAPAAPSPIPRDPLSPARLAPRPWTQKVFTIALLSPIPVLILFWLILAWRRARVTDPNRIQREAAARIRSILDDIQSAKEGAKVHRRLQAWQQETAVLWRFAPVVPRPQDFIRVSPAGDASAQVWANLWADAERVLYRSNETLPGDWVKRAQIAVDEKHLPAFSALQLFELKNLLPFAAVWIFVALALPHLVAQEADANQSYGAGKFAAAETAWQKAVSINGNDWVARHNLALALEQQSRWGEASAEAIAAFVQHPSDPAVRWNFAFAMDHAGFAPGLTTGFVAESPTYSLARLFSPAEWQRLMVGAAFVIAVGLGLVLLRFYAPLGAWSTYTGFAIAAVAGVALILGAVAINRYQETGDVRSVIIWKPSLLRSIPTEVDATQKTSPLAPGTIAIVDKTFLTWNRLSFSNGQTGWVRQEDFVRLWE